jgi:hypothetical protein
MKQGEETEVVLRVDADNFMGAGFDLATGTVTYTDAGVTATIKESYNGYYICTMTFDGADYSGIVFIYPRQTGVFESDGTSGIFIWHTQLEEGSQSTSVIPDGGASQVTRAADFCVRTLGNEFNSVSSTIYAEISELRSELGFFGVIEINSGASGDRYLSFVTDNAGDLNFAITIGGTFLFSNIVIKSAPFGDSTKIAATFRKDGLCEVVVDGVLKGSATNNIGPLSPTTLNIGNRGYSDNPVSVLKIKELFIYPKALTQSELITLTGGA